MKKLESSSVNTPADLLRTVGMTLAFKVGGAAGPLYGTAFMKASEAVKGKETLLLDDLLPMLEFAIEGIQLRGKAVRGEKTMLDALIPAKEALDQALAEGLAGDDALDAMIKAAEEGAEYTKTIIATKGRASYVGERSIGHMDPGAASSCLLLHAIKTY
jgi:dihydroxyacetone kinase-like protein